MKKITFICLTPDMQQAFMDHTPRLIDLGLDVEVVRKPLQHWDAQGVDVLFTPGNSFGHMTGGFDGAVIERFGVSIQENLATEIAISWCGEIPVGSAQMIKPDPFTGMRVAYAPTMRVPMELPADTDVPYVATWAALCAMHQHQIQVEHVAMPGMGANTGGVRPKVVAHQMVTAIENYVRRPTIQELFKDGVRRHEKILRHN